MAQNKKAIPQVENIDHYLHGVAKYLVDRVYGPDGPPWGTTLTELEDVALAIREQISEQMLTQALQRQAQAHPQRPPDYRDCPSCGRHTEPTDEPQARLLTTRGGEVDWLEPEEYCRKCRRAFFPSVQKPGH